LIKHFKIMRKTLLLIVALFASFWAIGQEKCASHTYEQELRAKYPHLGTVEQFEQWMAQKITERKNNPIARTGPYKIATIIHVIHAGDAIGNNSRNIPYGQAISQIRVLNEDFQRTNADASNTRAIFLPSAGSMPDLEFVAATKDPNGNVLPEPGVRRINGQAQFGITVWSQSSCNSTLKPATVWNPDQYLNIWVVDFGSAGLFGYAQFPEGSSLPGMPTTSQPSNTDGVVINYRSMGSNYDAAGNPVSGGPYITSPLSPGTDRGRTTTHEIGHWLGLRHSWGDGGCTVDDFCADTPWQGGDSPLTTDCANSQTRNTCTTIDTPYGVDAPDQIENYMDYSADVCMNMFTANQVTRMYTVMDNSPRRNTLTANAAIVAAPVLTGAYPGIYPSRTNIIETEQVNFFGVGRMGDNETPNTVTSWQWNFDVDGIGGAVPATFSGQNPGNVTFNRAGAYRVRLTISNGTTSGFTEVIINSALKAPSGVNFLDVQGSGSNAKVIDVAKIRWTDNSNSEANYVIERKKNTEPNSAYAVIATLPPNSTAYDDNFTSNSSLETGITYNYRVSAVKPPLTPASATRSIILERTTALDDTPLAREISIYPNPAQSSFTVDLRALQVSSAQLQLHNTIGQVVAQKTTQNGEVNFDVQKLPKGMYLLKINTEKGNAVKRIVIQ
jgi:hypothetical protein